MADRMTVGAGFRAKVNRIHYELEPDCPYDRPERCSGWQQIKKALRADPGSPVVDEVLVAQTRLRALREALQFFPVWTRGTDSQFHYEQGWNAAMQRIKKALVAEPVGPTDFDPITGEEFEVDRADLE
jgi:hypothetical protein